MASFWNIHNLFPLAFLSSSHPSASLLPFPSHTPVLQECSLHLAVIGSLWLSFFLQTRDRPMTHPVSGSDLLLLRVRNSCQESDFGFGFCQRNAKDRDEMTPQGEL